MEPRGRGRARRGRGEQVPYQQAARPGPGPGPSHSRGTCPPQGKRGRSEAPPQQYQRQYQQQAPPKTAWGPSQPKEAQFGRGSRIEGGGDEKSQTMSVTTKVVAGSGDAGLRDSQPKERGGGNGVRGRTNRNEIIHTRPANIQSKTGTSGDKIRLTANYFKLINKPDWCLHQYRVDFLPEVEDTRMRKKLVHIAYKKENDIGGFLFDGTVLYTPLILKPEPLVRVAQLNDSENITITVRRVGEIAWGDHHYLSVFNIIVRKCLNLMKLQMVGREYYDPNAKVDINQHKLCLWPGYFTSIRQYERDIMLNCELTFKVMRKDNVYDLLNSSIDRRTGNHDLNMFRNTVIGFVVLTFYNNKTYRIDDVDFDQNPNSAFPLRNGERITYVEYYKMKYGIHIQVPTQPLLVSRPSPREIRAGMPEVLYLIPELCQLTGLSDDQRANFQLMSALAQYTRVGPRERQSRLQEFASKMAKNADVMAQVKQWDMSLANELVKFEGRVLPQEKITVGPNIAFKSGPKADWTQNLRSNPMIVSGQMKHLAVICPKTLESGAHEFMQKICTAARGMEWSLENTFKIHTISNDRSHAYVDKCLEVFANKPTLVITVLPSKTSERYNAIKKLCYVDRGVPNQVILAKNFNSKGAMSIATKIAIQLNCKIGGAPWTVHIPLSDVLFVGYDVCRDTTRSGKSYGAMVASLDRACTRYYSSVYEHTNAEELSNNFGTFMLLACHQYKQQRGVFPGRICIFRDGVGDGQLPFVVEHEVKIIKSKLESEIYHGENELKMAFIIVTKRINTRIFNGNMNPPPGTVVDNTITLPERYDFYIVSQCVNQGTVSPTSYNIVYDTMGLPPDKYQILAYKLCHLYYNWSGTIRVPAPCQYAHKLAMITAQNLHRPAHKNLENFLFFL